MQFRTSVIDRTLPRVGTAFWVALEFQRRDTPTQSGHGAHATRQTSSLKHTDLDARQMQPASICGRGVDIDSRQDPPGISRRKRFREDGRCVGVQSILRSAASGMSLRHVDTTPAGQRFDHEEDAHTQSRSVRFVPVQQGAGAARPHEVRTSFSSQQIGDIGDSLPLHAHSARLPGTRGTAHRPRGCTAARVGGVCVHLFEHLADYCRRDGSSNASLDRFSGTKAQRPTVVAIGNRDTSTSDQGGGLFARRCLALALLFPGMPSRFQSPIQVRSSHVDSRLAMDAESIADVGVGPALASFQQGICSCEGSRVGFARVRNRVM